LLTAVRQTSADWTVSVTVDCLMEARSGCIFEKTVREITWAGTVAGIPPHQKKNAGSGTCRPRRETRFFGLDTAPTQTITTGQTFTPSLQLAREESCEQKTSFVADFTRVFLFRVKPYSNDVRVVIVSC
jgi:hypothetical protein